MTGSASGEINRLRYTIEDKIKNDFVLNHSNSGQTVAKLVSDSDKFTYHFRKINALFDINNTYLISISEDKRVAMLAYS